MDELESLLNQIYGAVADPTRWPDVLVSVADHPDATSGTLVYQARSGGQSMAVLGRLSQELLDVYFKHYAWDVWSTAMKDKPVGHVLPLGSLVDNRALRRTAFYADVLAPKASKTDSPSTSLPWRATADSGDLAFIFPRAPRTPPNTIENGCSG